MASASPSPWSRSASRRSGHSPAQDRQRRAQRVEPPGVAAGRERGERERRGALFERGPVRGRVVRGLGVAVGVGPERALDDGLERVGPGGRSFGRRPQRGGGTEGEQPEHLVVEEVPVEVVLVGPVAGLGDVDEPARVELPGVEQGEHAGDRPRQAGRRTRGRAARAPRSPRRARPTARRPRAPPARRSSPPHRRRRSTGPAPGGRDARTASRPSGGARRRARRRPKRARRARRSRRRAPTPDGSSCGPSARRGSRRRRARRGGRRGRSRGRGGSGAPEHV